MQHFGLRHYGEGVAGEAYAPAEVNLFHVSEEGVVESADLSVEVGAHHEGGAAGPVYVDGVLILPFVDFAGGKDASAAVGVAVAVEESAASAGVFKFVGVVPAEDFGLTGAAPGVRFHIFEHGAVPAGPWGDVGVEQDGIGCGDLLDCEVISAGKSVVFGEVYGAQAEPAHIVERAVG